MFILSCYIQVFLWFCSISTWFGPMWILGFVMANFKLHYAPISEKIAAIFEFLTKQKMFKNTGAEHWKISLFMFCKLDYFKLGFGELLTYNLVVDKNIIFFFKFYYRQTILSFMVPTRILHRLTLSINKGLALIEILQNFIECKPFILKSLHIHNIKKHWFFLP